MQFAANLRLPGSHEQKHRLVSKLLADLKLERVADTLIGGAVLKGISVGERKRTSIAVELIIDPALLFLDEPISGLDSCTAFVIINLLKIQAAYYTFIIRPLINSFHRNGKTIVFTIHQPTSDIFELFDRYMVLSNGTLIYQVCECNIELLILDREVEKRQSIILIL